MDTPKGAAMTREQLSLDFARPLAKRHTNLVSNTVRPSPMVVMPWAAASSSPNINPW